MNCYPALFEARPQTLRLYRFCLPFNQPLTFKGHTLVSREGLWLIDYSPSGRRYIGEICPLPGFSQETLQQCEQQIIALLHAPTASLNPLLPSVAFALFCLQQKVSFKAQKETPSSLHSVPLLQGQHSEIMTRYHALDRPDLIKLKVARAAVALDIELIQDLIAINPALRFRLDANQQWSAQQYLFFLQQIDAKYIDYIEEPTLSLNDNLNISMQYHVSLALDESLLKYNSVPIHDTIKVLIIKPTLIGYPARLTCLLKHAQQHQLGVSISASFESPLALNQLKNLAQQWQQQYQINITLGLDTLTAFKNNGASDLSIEHLLTQATCLWQQQ